jgi:hypothetical protein
MRYSNWRRDLRLLGPLALAVAGLAACSGSGGGETRVIAAGQVDVRDVQPPPGWKATAGGGARPDPGASETTIPLAKEDSSSAFLNATQKFQQCLTNNGVKFVGAPDASNPSSPANDPNYVKSLSTCAAQSNIVQAMKDQQAAQATQTPEQIQKSNEGYLAWRDCMIAKGWDIPKPTPDGQGRLFSMSGGGGGGGAQIKAPPGKDLLTSTDTRDCAAEASKKTGAGG